MRDFDLIPASYRAQLLIYGLIRRWAVLLGFTVLLIVVAIGLLSTLNERSKQQLAEVTAQTTAADARASRYKAMRAVQTTLREQSKVLGALQSRGATSAILAVVEQASIAHPVWLQQWEYQRGHADRVQQSRVHLRGEATHHGALVGFVEALLAEPKIDDVRIAQSNEAVGRDSARVRFRLELLLVST